MDEGLCPHSTRLCILFTEQARREISGLAFFSRYLLKIFAVIRICIQTKKFKNSLLYMI